MLFVRPTNGDRRHTSWQPPRGWSILLAVLLAGPVAVGDPPSVPALQGLGDLSGGTAASCAMALSADGRVVTGWATTEAGTRAFMWRDGAMSDLGVGPDGVAPLVGHTVSPDGQVIAGLAQMGTSTIAFRWEDGQVTLLPAPAGVDAVTDAWGISTGAGTVVGHSQSQQRYSALVWSGQEIRALPDLPGAQHSSVATAVSADGKVIAGHSESSGRPRAVAWHDGIILDLGDLPGGDSRSESRGISANGAVIVGSAASAFGFEAFKWEEGEMTGLGALSREHEFLSVARAASADGSVIVGYSIDDRDASQAAAWDGINGIRSLSAILSTEFGANLHGWRLDVATGVSADGTTIAGCGRNPQGNAEAWIMRLPDQWWRDAFTPFRPNAAGSADNPEGAPMPYIGRELALVGQLLEPVGVAIAADQTTYIADSGHSLIVVLDAAGNRSRTWGSPGSGLSFDAPQDVTIVNDGSVLVADTGGHRVQLISPGGRLRKRWGARGSSPGELLHPEGIASQAERVYVADTGNDRVQVFDIDGRFRLSLGGSGHQPGQLAAPTDVSVHDDGRVFVADTGNDRICAFGADGSLLRCWGERGASLGLFNHPTGIECRGDFIYVVDHGNHRVQVLNADGTFRYTWGRQVLRPHEANGRVFYPSRIAIAPDHTRAVVCEPYEDRCQSFRMFEDVPHARGPLARLSDNGATTNVGGALHVSGETLVVTDVTMDHVLVYRLTEHDPVLVTKIASPGHGAGQLSDPRGLWFDAESGGLLVSDSANRRVQLFEVPFTIEEPVTFKPNLGRLVKTFDAAGWQGGSAAALTARPRAIARSRGGTVAIADEFAGRVLLVHADFSSPKWTTQTPGTAAESMRPVDLAFSHDSEKLLVLDAANRAVVVFDSGGTYIDSWGVGPRQAEDDVLPCGMEAGLDGFVYVSDCAGHRIRKFRENGEFVVQWGRRGVGAGEFFKPRGIAQDPRGRIYVNDFGNRRIQVFSSDGTFLRAIGPPLCIHPTLVGSTN